MASQPNITSCSALAEEVDSRKRLLRTQSLPPTKIASNAEKSALTGEESPQQKQSSQKDAVDPDNVINVIEDSHHSVGAVQESQQMTDSQLKYAMLEKRCRSAGLEHEMNRAREDLKHRISTR